MIVISQDFDLQSDRSAVIEPTAENDAPEVLFVGLTAGDLPEGLASQLQERDSPAVFCGDVYRALARIGRQSPVAVVVAVDWLSASELEFFEILARSYGELPVYVVGADRARGKIDRAVACGASGVATLDAFVRELSDAAQAAPSASPAPSATPPIVAMDSDSDSDDDAISFASTGNVFDAELDMRLRDVAGDTEIGGDESTQLPDPADRLTSHGDEVSDEKPAGSARVPWMRYGGGPQRTPPTPPTHVPSNGNGAEPQAVDDLGDTPLLTPEELEALLADDLDERNRDDS